MVLAGGIVDCAALEGEDVNRKEGRTQEGFARYQIYLSQRRYWPSESSNDSIAISTMVPRHAASALAKLMRWAETLQAQVALNITPHQMRRDFVRNTPLAQALANVAMSQPVEANASEDAEEVTPRDMILLFAPVIAEHTDLDITQIFKLAEALATKADEEWTTTVQSR